MLMWLCDAAGLLPLHWVRRSPLDKEPYTLMFVCVLQLRHLMHAVSAVMC